MTGTNTAVPLWLYITSFYPACLLVEMVMTTYCDSFQVRDKLLGSQPEQLKRRALDPRAFESRAALRSNMFSSSQPGEELRPVRVDFKTGDEVLFHPCVDLCH